MLTFLTVLTFGMVMTLVAVMAAAEAPPTPAPVRKAGPRTRTSR